MAEVSTLVNGLYQSGNVSRGYLCYGLLVVVVVALATSLVTLRLSKPSPLSWSAVRAGLVGLGLVAMVGHFAVRKILACFPIGMAAITSTGICLSPRG